MDYNPEVEKFVDFVDFTKDDPCIWVVFTAGAAGDLIASMISLHYAKPAARFLGIADNGQVIFRDSNSKKLNNDKRLELVVENINKTLSNEYNSNYSKIDQIILSNHNHGIIEVTKILENFSQAKIIRITPANSYENDIVNWLSNLKNKNQLTDFVVTNKAYSYNHIEHPSVLNLTLSDIINQDKFEQTYQRITEHLNLKYKLIRYDLINYWLSKQHPNIIPDLKKL